MCFIDFRYLKHFGFAFFRNFVLTLVMLSFRFTGEECREGGPCSGEAGEDCAGAVGSERNIEEVDSKPVIA